MKNLINKYNEEPLLVISSWPRKNQKYSKGVCAVASFAKNTLLAMQKSAPNQKIVVLTMKLGKKQEIYEENGMLIVRCFQRINPLSYLNLISNIRKFKLAKNVLLEFEFSSFGNLFATASLSLVIWALFLLGKKINIIIHQVLLNLNELSGHIGLSKKSFKMHFLNFALKNFYKFICFPTSNIFVLEDELKNRLKNIVNGDKITVIPHGVDQQLNTNFKKTSARKRLNFKENDLVILYFGYLTWYKGVDFLVKSFRKITQIKGKKVKLIVAGGPSFTQGQKEHYKKFLAKTINLAKGFSHIKITGFVPENQIATYFNAADISILPYREFMSSSGPFSIALSFGKPVLVSSNLSPLLNSKDAKEALAKANLSKEDLVFKLTEKDLVAKLAYSQKKLIFNKMVVFSKNLSNKRDFEEIAPKYLSTISENYARIYNRKLLMNPNIAR